MPDTLDVNASAVVFALLQTVCAVGVTVITGIGFTVMVNVCTAPTQPFAVGVTVSTPAAEAVLVFVPVKEAIEPPVPLAPIPIVVLLLLHA